MNRKDYNNIKKILEERHIDRAVFRNEDNKLSPIQYGDMAIAGIFISSMGIIWLVDDTRIRKDISGNIREDCYKDKHFLLNFDEGIISEIIKRL